NRGGAHSTSGSFPSAVCVVNRIEHRPEHIAFELEGAHRFPLKPGRVAILKRNRERLVGISPGLSDSASKIIESTKINPRIEFFECCKTRTHQIGRKKLCQRGCDGDRPRLTTRKIHVCVHGESNSGQEVAIAYQLVAR